eukprot:1268_1
MDDDFFAGVDLDQLMAQPAEMAPYERCFVLEVTQISFEEKKLRAVNDDTAKESTIILRGEWASSIVRIGDFVHVIGHPEPNSGTFIVDDERNLLILHPDCLISGSVIGTSYPCVRRTVLSQKIQGGGSGKAALFGSLTHDVFEKCLTERNFSKENILHHADQTIQDYIAELYAIDESEASTREFILKLVPTMGRFSSSFLCSTPQISSTVDWEHSQQSLCIPDVLDTEENIWSPKYGLKGKLDASVRISHRPYTNRSSSEALPKL